MSYDERTGLVQRDLSAQLGTAPYTFKPDATWGEAFRAGREETRELELLNSRDRLRSEFQQPQIDEMQSLIDNGAIDEDTVAAFSGVVPSPGRRSVRAGIKWDALGEYLNETQGTTFDFSEDAMKVYAQERNAQREDVFDRTSGINNVAPFLGSMFSYAVDDPMTAILLALPQTAPVTRATMAASIGTMAVREAGVSMAVEVANQAQIMQFKRSLEIDHGFDEAAANVVIAGLFGAATGSAYAGWREMGPGQDTVAQARTRVHDHIERLIDKGEFDPVNNGYHQTQKELLDFLDGQHPRRRTERAMEARDLYEDNPYGQLFGNDDANRAVTTTNALVARAGQLAGDGEARSLDNYTPDLELDALPVIDFDKDGNATQRTFAEERAEADAEVEAANQRLDAYLTCRIGT